MTDTEPPELENWKNYDILEPIDAGKYFLRTPGIDFDTMTRGRNWFIVASTYQLYEEMRAAGLDAAIGDGGAVPHSADAADHGHVAGAARPVGDFCATRTATSSSAPDCVSFMCAVFFGACFACKYLGDHDYMTPALAAWLPVLFLGRSASCCLMQLRT